MLVPASRPWPSFSAARRSDQAGDEALLHRPGDQEARRRDADLPGVAELCADRDPGRTVDIAVFGHDHRRMATQFHRDALHVGPGQRCQLLAHRGRAGEGDLADHRMRDQVGTDHLRPAIDQAQHAGRDAAIDKGTHQFGRRGRGLLRRLGDHRAAGGQRCAELANQLVDREVPRREGRHRAHRLLEHLRDLALAARCDDAAADARAFLGKPLDDVGAEAHLGLGLGERLAVLQR
jgi:hypothetical protein